MICRKKISAFFLISFLSLSALINSSCIGGADKGEMASREQAVSTVSSFLEMYKQGQIEEAARKYFDYNNAQIGDVFPIKVDKIIGYTVDPSASAVGQWEGIPPARIVLADVQISSEESVGLAFFCSDDGTRIYLVGISEGDVKLPPLGRY